MPSTYAHYRFGLDVCKTLQCREQKIIDAYPELYMIGLHGPDILFYYDALSSNSVNRTGYELHEKSGKIFFENARNVIASSKSPDASLSYAYGVLCHFALDVNCHAYVDEKIAISGISHAEIESEFDRSLMLLDGIEPTTHIQTAHISPHGNPLCEDSNAKLMELYHLAESQAKLFITSFDGYLSEKQELDPIFDYTFNGALSVSEENI